MMKKLSVLLILAILALVGWFFASPYWTLYQLKTAVQAQDIDGMVQYVDFPSVRNDLKDQLKSELSNNIQPTENNGFEMLGTAIVMAAVDGMIDQMITPNAIKTVLEGKTLADNLGKSLNSNGLDDNADDSTDANADNATPAETAPKLQFDTDYQNANQLAVNIRTEDQKDAKVILTREGLFGWKITQIKLPPSDPTAN